MISHIFLFRQVLIIIFREWFSVLVQVKLKIDLNWLIPKFDWLIANKSEGFTNMEKKWLNIQ